MAKKASDHITYYKNENGPLLSTVERNILHQDGMAFKDIDGSGTVSTVNDWRKSPKERAKAYVKELTLDEKIGQLFISDWRMGKYPSDPKQQPLLDESGTLDEGEFHGKTIFGEQTLPGTSTLLKDWFARHLILRANPSAQDLTDYLNQLHKVAEECTHFVPVCVASNSRNEHGDAVFGMNDAAGVFPAWPGTLGIAAAVNGSGIETADQFANAVRKTWNTAGLRKGYMYMADVLTDPRWQRTFGTFGEDPKLTSLILEHIIPGIQGSKDGVTSDGVAMTTKHFPGVGARENGFDPHYKEGQWNVYPTKGSLQTYHLPPFQTAVDCHTSSIMPYYAKPCAAKSAPQTDCSGSPVEMEPYGFAYNRVFINELLRKQMGFQGYINSDTGIVHNMCWGVENLDEPERVAFAVNYGGTSLISGLFDNQYAKTAYERGKTNYYQHHPVPDGFAPDDLILTEDAINRAAAATLEEKFALGMFEHPYRSPKEAAEASADPVLWAQAMDAHRKSVVLLKNDGVLPLAEAKRSGKKIFAKCFAKDAGRALRLTEELTRLLQTAGCSLTDEPQKADYGILMLFPSSGEYFSATKGFLELDICEKKTVANVDDRGIPTTQAHEETTLLEASKIAEIASQIHSRGGKVIANINFTLAWEIGNVEPYTDALLAGFDTYQSALLDVIFGNFAPSGRLPLTLPRNDEVLAVDANGVCVSPNDVPGYEKDRYMPDCMKDENGKAYAYQDRNGNYYELGFGLRYEKKLDADDSLSL